MKLRTLLLILFLLSFPFLIINSVSHFRSASILQAFTDKLFLFCLLLSIIFILLSHYFRAFVTAWAIKPVSKTATVTQFKALSIGYAFSSLLPLKLGEIFRALTLSRYTSLSFTYTLIVIAFQKSIDAIILGFFGIIFYFLFLKIPGYSTTSLLLLSSLIFVSGVLASFVIRLLYTRNNIVLKIIKSTASLMNDKNKYLMLYRAWSAIYGMDKSFSSNRLVKYVFLSISMWVFYFLSVTPLLVYFLSKNLSVSQIGMSEFASFLGSSLSMSPTNAGSFYNTTSIVDLNSLQPLMLKELFVTIWLVQIVPIFIFGLYYVLISRERLFRTINRFNLDKAGEDKLLRRMDHSAGMRPFLNSFFNGDALSHITYQLELNNNIRLVKYFKGGSNAITGLYVQGNQFIVRKITDSKHAYKLKSQYNWLNKHRKLKKIVNVTGEHEDKHYYSIGIKYKKDYSPFFDAIHSSDIKLSKSVLASVYEYLFKYVYQLKPASKDLDAFNLYIDNRCVRKIEAAARISRDIEKLYTYKQLNINGRMLNNIPEVIRQIKGNKRMVDAISTYRRCSIHGDVTVDNILYSKKHRNFLLIDPTDNENEISGPVFDFGRSTQSLKYGYEFLCSDDSTATPIGNKIDFTYIKSTQYEELYLELLSLQKKYLTKDEYLATIFHAAVCYSRMLTHRVVINPKNVAKYYAVSTIAFNDFIKGFTND